jgi:Asp-tRNA(Asn)/Glu-tRNA(Gln) amidotransferase A subunit family amidase
MNRACKSILSISAALALATGLPGQNQRNDSGAHFQVAETTIDEIHAAMKSGKLTARQLVQAYLDRISAFDKKGPALNCIITLNSRALEDADKLDAVFKRSGLLGPLHGIPVLVKDEIDTAGMPTTLGTVVFKDYQPSRDAFAIERLRKAGAIILGKTTLGEFAMGDTYGSLFGVSRNPYDLERTVGGSSGGSACAVTASFATVAIGEETLASLRRPAAWNDVVSLRPTPGLVSRSGMWDGYPSPTAQMGPMARTVKDLAQLLDAMVGYDAEDPVTALGVGQAPPSYTKALDRNGLKGARIGVLRESIGLNSEPESDDFKKVDTVFQNNVAELKAAGATVVDPIVIPNLKMLLSKRATNNTIADEALRHYLTRNTTSQFKTRDDIAKSPELSKIMLPNTARQWTTPLRNTDLARWGEYLQAREDLMIQIQKVMADHRLDAIVHKTVEHQPTFIKNGINPPYVNTKGVPVLNTFLVYAASVTVPSGFTSDDLPVGITFFGKPYSEPALLRLAYAYEQTTLRRVPPKTTPPLP